jgi:diketogulonate reductase-like aldo/keto reductase
MVSIQTRRRAFSLHRRGRCPRAHDSHAHQPSRLPAGLSVSRARTTSAVVVYVSSLQFYWQDYSNKGYMTALRYLQDLQAEGLITTLGIVNFDAIRTDEICTQLGPGAIVSNQVQVCTRISSRVRRAR